MAVLFLQFFSASGSKFRKLQPAEDEDTTESHGGSTTGRSHGNAGASPTSSSPFPLFRSEFKSPHLQKEVLGTFIGTRRDLEQLRQVSKHGYEKVMEAVDGLREQGQLKLRRRFKSREELAAVMWLWKTPRFRFMGGAGDGFYGMRKTFGPDMRALIGRIGAPQRAWSFDLENNEQPYESPGEEEQETQPKEKQKGLSEEDMEALRQATIREYGPVDEWDVGDVEELSDIFGCRYLPAKRGRHRNQFVRDWSSKWLPSFTVTNWRTKGVRSMKKAFDFCGTFNQPLNWDTSTVEDMSLMFREAADFNQALAWDVRKVKNMFKMFEGCTAFNHPSIARWQTDSVETTIPTANTDGPQHFLRTHCLGR